MSFVNMQWSNEEIAEGHTFESGIVLASGHRSSFRKFWKCLEFPDVKYTAICHFSVTLGSQTRAKTRNRCIFYSSSAPALVVVLHYAYCLPLDSQALELSNHAELMPWNPRCSKLWPEQAFHHFHSVCQPVLSPRQP